MLISTTTYSVSVGHGDCAPIPAVTVPKIPNVIADGMPVLSMGDYFGFHPNCDDWCCHPEFVGVSKTKAFILGHQIATVTTVLTMGDIVATGAPNINVGL